MEGILSGYILASKGDERGDDGSARRLACSTMRVIAECWWLLFLLLWLLVRVIILFRMVSKVSVVGSNSTTVGGGASS